MAEKKPVDETKVLGRMSKELEGLTTEQRARVLTYLVRRFTDGKNFTITVPEALLDKVEGAVG